MNELAEQLAGIADEVRPADLGARVRDASRRVRRRRRFAAVAVLVLFSALVWVGWPAPKEPPVEVVTNHAGDLFYYEGRQVVSFDGIQVRAVLDLPEPVCGVTVSPDHEFVAWTDVDPVTGLGPLMVAPTEPAGSGARKIADEVRCSGGDMPYWTPDSVRMLISQPSFPVRRNVDVRSGQIFETALADLGSYVAFSPNGLYAAYAEAGQIIVARVPDGSIVRRVEHKPETFGVYGISDDGRRVMIGARNINPDILRYGYQQVDTVTGGEIALPPAVAPARAVDAEVHPAAGNRLLVRFTGNLFLLDPSGKVVQHRVEPDTLATATLLQ